MTTKIFPFEQRNINTDDSMNAENYIKDFKASWAFRSLSFHRAGENGAQFYTRFWDLTRRDQKNFLKNGD